MKLNKVQLYARNNSNNSSSYTHSRGKFKMPPVIFQDDVLHR